jgi:tripartite-type tricarboxylate transporter receptor subunit TctC
LAVFVGLCLGLSPAPSLAQANAPIRLVVGYAAGGPLDGAARQFAPILSRELGRTEIVDNRVGAGGVLGAERVSKSPADGDTLYFGASPTITISPRVLKSMKLDPAKDRTAIAPVLSYANVLVVNKGATTCGPARPRRWSPRASVISTCGAA